MKCILFSELSWRVALQQPLLSAFLATLHRLQITKNDQLP